MTKSTLHEKFEIHARAGRRKSARRGRTPLEKEKKGERERETMIARPSLSTCETLWVLQTFIIQGECITFRCAVRRGRSPSFSRGIRPRNYDSISRSPLFSRKENDTVVVNSSRYELRAIDEGRAENSKLWPAVQFTIS